MLTLDMPIPIPQLPRQSTSIPTHMQTTFIPIRVNTHILTNMYTHVRMLTLNIPIPVTQLPQRRQATTATLISTSTTSKSLRVLQSVVDCCSALRTVAVCCRLRSPLRRQLNLRGCCSELQTVADIQISHFYVSRSVSLLQSVAVCCRHQIFTHLRVQICQFVAVCCSLLQTSKSHTFTCQDLSVCCSLSQTSKTHTGLSLDLFLSWISGRSLFPFSFCGGSFPGLSIDCLIARFHVWCSVLDNIAGCGKSTTYPLVFRLKSEDPSCLSFFIAFFHTFFLSWGPKSETLFGNPPPELSRERKKSIINTCAQVWLHFNTLQHTNYEWNCDTLQHTSSGRRCNTLQNTTPHKSWQHLQHTAPYCNILLTRCNSLHHTATYC